MKNFTLFFLMLVLISCSSQKGIINDDNLGLDSSNQKFEELLLPNWFMNMPQEEGIAIGIAASNSYNPEVSDSTIKANASVFANRNKSAIVIAKLKMKENQSTVSPILSDFKLQVASDIPELKRYYTNTKILDKSEIKGMTIALVGENACDFYLDKSHSISNREPLWYLENAYFNKDNCLFACGKSSAVDLATAYNNAYNEAVYNLIKGVKSHVTAAIISSHQYIEKFVEIDASLIIEKMRNTRNSVVLRKLPNGHIYDAFVEIKWQPKYQVQELKIKD